MPARPRRGKTKKPVTKGQLITLLAAANLAMFALGGLVLVTIAASAVVYLVLVRKDALS